MAQEIKESLPQLMAKFREERFIESDPRHLSLIKIGEYVRTPLYEPSIGSMCLSLTDVRKQLAMDKATNKQLAKAWNFATKMYNLRSAYLKSKFQGPEEYCIAIICFTLDEPYKVYHEFNRVCQELMTNTWCYFPYKSLFYLLIQSEMRLMNIDDNSTETLKRIKALRNPITITTDLDYSIEEEEENTSIEENGSSLSLTPSPTARKIHTSSPIKRGNIHRAYRGLGFPVGEKDFKPRDLVSFSHIMSTTLDSIKLTKLLEDMGKPVTLLEIDQISWSSRYVASLSLFPVEKEVIIWPWVKFYVYERKMIRKNVEKIVLRPTSRSFTEENQ